MRSLVLPICLAAAVTSCATVPAEDARISRTDHFVTVKSPAPALAGAETKLYVREVTVAGGASPIPAADRVVLFIHGSGTPAEVSFDVGYKDYSWMAYLARAGFDTFEVRKDSDAEAFAATAKRYSVFYQPTGDGRLTALHRRMQLRHSESAGQ